MVCLKGKKEFFRRGLSGPPRNNVKKFLNTLLGLPVDLQVRTLNLSRLTLAPYTLRLEAKINVEQVLKYLLLLFCSGRSSSCSLPSWRLTSKRFRVEPSGFKAWGLGFKVQRVFRV